MNWEALGAIVELVGSVAVVFTLAYLAIETRRNTIAIALFGFMGMTSWLRRLSRHMEAALGMPRAITSAS